LTVQYVKPDYPKTASLPAACGPACTRQGAQKLCFIVLCGASVATLFFSAGSLRGPGSRECVIPIVDAQLQWHIFLWAVGALAAMDARA